MEVKELLYLHSPHGHSSLYCLCSLTHWTPFVPRSWQSLCQPEQSCGNNQVVGMIIQTKNPLFSPIYSISLVKLMQTIWVKAFFVCVCVLTWPGQWNVSYIPYSMHWREGLSFCMKTCVRHNTSMLKWVYNQLHPRDFDAHCFTQLYDCKQGVRRDNYLLKELQLDSLYRE